MRIPVDSAEARELRDDVDEPPMKPAPDVRPPWCGYCHRKTRLIDVDDKTVRRCPACHPLTG